MNRFLLSAFVLVVLPISLVAQNDIRKVDFKNFTYSARCAAKTTTKVTVKDGEFSKEKQEDGYVDRFLFNVLNIAYGDLTGDRQDEAIVLGVCNMGGTGNFSEGFVYSFNKGKPTLVARIPGGDRAYGGLRSTRVENSLLVVESNDPGKEGGSCCPQIIVTTKYRLAGGRITPVGNQTRRPIYPSERVTFAAGASGKTFAVTIPADEGKRFVVGARAEQTLTVSIDSDKASLSLLEELEPKFGVNNFEVKLPKNGNYTIEVQNNSDAALTLTINIKIQ